MALNEWTRHRNPKTSRHSPSQNLSPFPNGDGAVANTDTANYNAAFPNAASGMGCAATCTGYELMNNLNFDTDGSGSVDSSDDYPNWTPIGGSYSATFDGNAHTISNLTINSTNTTISTGLFNTLGNGGVIRNVGIMDATVSGRGGSNRGVAILVGLNDGTVSASYVQGGSVTATSQTANLGGLVGRNNNIITTSYSRASVSGNLYNSFIGGLVGTVASSGRVIASYAAGSVSGNSLGGGTTFGGFFGRTVSTASITNSYCDTQAAGRSCNGTRASGSTANAPGYTTSQLQTPITYTGVYANWNLDLDGDRVPDPEHAQPAPAGN